MMDGKWSRRRVVTAAVSSVGALWVGGHGGLGALVPGARAALTPACEEGGATVSLTEGPFYTPDSPEKTDFRDDGSGDAVTLTGRVVDTRCQPVAGAVVDLWHADDLGRYDNSGYRYRGHVRTGTDGSYRFETIRPGYYGSRTRHYHVKIAAPRRRVLTTQLYLPGEPRNDSDWLFREALLVSLDRAHRVLVASFEFVVPVG